MGIVRISRPFIAADSGARRVYKRHEHVIIPFVHNTRVLLAAGRACCVSALRANYARCFFARFARKGGRFILHEYRYFFLLTSVDFCHNLNFQVSGRAHIINVLAC
jgi:hypothetical protein